MYLVFDIGGTKMRIATSVDGENLDPPVVFSTPEKLEEATQKISEAVGQLAGGKKIEKAAGGIRGILNPEKTSLYYDQHLSAWVDQPIKKSFEDVLGCPVFLENDTAMVGLGESVKGAGVDHEIFIYMTISTGVGGVRIVNKRIDESNFGFEPGHQIIDADGSIWFDKVAFQRQGWRPGELESLVSGTAVKERYGKQPYEITDDKVWDDLSHLLAQGLANSILHWSPNAIILGGGMMKSPGISIKKVNFYLSDILRRLHNLPTVKLAQLKDFGGLHGALWFLKSMKTKQSKNKPD